MSEDRFLKRGCSRHAACLLASNAQNKLPACDLQHTFDVSVRTHLKQRASWWMWKPTTAGRSNKGECGVYALRWMWKPTTAGKRALSVGQGLECRMDKGRYMQFDGRNSGQVLRWMWGQIWQASTEMDVKAHDS
eukprot:1160377-Pelagomonas_calceolata.AAC.14